MPIPVINQTASVQSRLQFNPFEFTLGATGNPVMWDVTNLPTGITLEALPAGLAVTGVAATGVLTASGHTFANGDKVFLRDKTGASGLIVNLLYYIRDANAGAGTFRLATTPNGTAVALGTDLSAGSIGRVMSGKVSGTPTVAGTVTAFFSASNNDGVSTAVPVTFGIGEAAATQDAAFNADVDLQSGILTIGAGVLAADEIPRAKEGDIRLMAVRFKKGETIIDLGTLTSLQFGVRESADDPLIVLGGGGASGSDGTPMKKTGTGTATVYLISISFTDALLSATLQDLDDGTPLLAELAWEEPNPTSSPRVGPATLPHSSRTTPFIVERQLIS